MAGTYGDAGPTYGDFFGPVGTYGNFADGTVIVVPPPSGKGWCAYAVGTIVTPPTDTTPPTVPTSVAASYDGVSTVTVTWTASTDAGAGVAGYGIYRNGIKVGASSTTTFLDVPPAGTYTYKVNAVDLAQPANVSSLSAASGSVTVGLPDTTPPSVPANVAAVATMTGATITWDASTDPTVAQFILGTSVLASTDVLVPGGGTSGIDKYVIYRNGTAIAFDTGSPYIDTVAASGTYSYQVAALDVAGNLSALSDPASVTINFTDQEAPSTPTGVGTTDLGSGQIRVSWTASTDNVAVTQYVIYRDSQAINFDTASPYVDTVTATGTYHYQVAALDAANNLSSLSSTSTISVTVAPPADTTPPSTPTGVTATHPSGQTVNVHWNASTDSGGSGLAGYVVYRNGTAVTFGTSTSFTDTVNNGTWTYTVKAYDNANNFSAASSGATVAVNVGFTPSLDTSGSNDVSAGMQSFFNGLPQGTTANPTVVNFPTNAIYRCEQSIHIKFGPDGTTRRRHLVIHGNNATIKQTIANLGDSKQWGAFWIDGISNADISIDHVNILGPNNSTGGDGYNALYRAPSGGITYEGQHGIRVTDSDDVHLDHYNVSHVWGDGWSFDGNQRCSDCTVFNSTAYWTGRHSLNPNSVDNFWSDSCTGSHAGRHQIDVEPDGAVAGCDGITISNWTGNGGALGFFSAIGGGSGGQNQLDNITIDTVNQTNQTAVARFGRASHQHHNVTLKNINGMHDFNNEQPNNQNYGGGIGDVFDFKNVTGITVQNCHQPVNPAHAEYMVGCDSNCTVVDVSGNSGANLTGELIGP